MAYDHKPNSGSLFKNDRKQKETHPDYKGDALINGRAVWIAAWIKKGKKGTFMSLSFEEKEQQPACEEDRPQQKTPQKRDPLAGPEEEQEVPF